MNYYERKNFIKYNKTKIEYVALEFWSQNKFLADTKEEAIKNFEEAIMEGAIGKEMIDVVYRAGLKNKKLLLRVGNSIEEVTPSIDEIKSYFKSESKL